MSERRSHSTEQQPDETPTVPMSAVPVDFGPTQRTRTASAPSGPIFDNSNQIGRLRYRFRSYLRLGTHALRRGVSIRSLATTRFPRILPRQPRPSSLSIELTDACNLRCDYCTNPLFARPRSFMSDETVSRLIEDIDELRPHRIRVGGGEATLHPRFDEISSALARRVRFVSVVTNAQWRQPSTIDALLDHYQLIEVSIDAGGAEVYESSRSGASFARLVDNLDQLSARRTARGSSALINVRLMLRPSTQHLAREESMRWSGIADAVMPQFVIEQRFDGTHDVFAPPQMGTDEVPRCTLPFKDLFVRADGSVPMCQVNGTDLDPHRRIVLGTLEGSTLADCWNAELLDEVRRAHRRGRFSVAAVEPCRGCSGR